ncbi:MAG: hypothetical protein ACXW2T_01465 [Allosphingosinicella sp.]
MSGMRILFRVLLVINLIAAAVLLFFFLWGLSDGSAYYALGTWLLILAAAIGLIWAALALNRRGHRAASLVVLLPVAGPAFLYGLFILAVVILQPRWN